MIKNGYGKNISFILKWLIVLSSLGGVILGLYFAKRDGYSHWATRLMYFTGQSNIWIGVWTILLLIFPYIKSLSTDKAKRILYIIRYIFTVSITVTGIVYCTLLAPFAYKENFDAWTLSNILTHVVAPILSVLDFFLDEYKFKVTKENIIFTAIPPLVYFIFAGTLNIFDVDFGRGDPYPYFFLNLKSPAGIFGFSTTPTIVLGSFYWILLFIVMIYTIAAVFMVINSFIMKKASE
jgi:hypothetical protein